MPCEHCINRREFLSTAAAGAAFVAVAGCGDGDVSGVAPLVQLPPGPVVITVGNFAPLANPGIFVQVPGVPIAVKRLDVATFLALSMVCTHAGCPVDIVSGQAFDCPCHRSTFDGNGSVTRGPAEQPLPSLSTTYHSATDQLTIG